MNASNFDFVGWAKETTSGGGGGDGIQDDDFD